MLLLAALLPASAHAADIRWGGDDSCHREQQVTDQIESMIRGPLADAAVADFRIDVRAIQPGGTYLLRLGIHPRSGEASAERVIEGASCADVTDAAAVAIALTIGTPDDQQLPSPALASETTNHRAPVPTGAASPRPRALRSPESEPRTLKWLLAVGGALDSSASPKPVFGGSARLALVAVRVRLEVEGTAFAVSTVENAQGQGGDFRLMYGASLGCFIATPAEPKAVVCLGYEVGQLLAEGRGVKVAHDEAQLWHAARGEFGVSWSLSTSWALGARLGGAVAFRRPRFVLDNPEAIHRPASVTLRSWLGVELAL